MKKIGLVGGMGPVSTIDYYMDLIDMYREDLGLDEYPDIAIDSINMTKMLSALAVDDHATVCKMITSSIHNLKLAGAEIAAICSNTPHIVWDEMADTFELPTISIVDAAVDEMLRQGYQRVLIFGTVYTMQSGLYEKKLQDKGITPIIPSDDDKQRIGNIIFPKLEQGIVVPEDKTKMIALAEKYIKNQNADAMLLGCTEIPLMIKEGDVSVPIINTTTVHEKAIYLGAK